MVELEHSSVCNEAIKGSKEGRHPAPKVGMEIPSVRMGGTKPAQIHVRVQEKTENL